MFSPSATMDAARSSAQLVTVSARTHSSWSCSAAMMDGS